MQLEQFELGIVGNYEETHGGYVLMAHGTKYAIFLRNSNSLRAEAEVSIDGEFVGTWRLNPYTPMKIERPPSSKKQFTFFAEKSKEARQAQLESVSPQDLGVVSVKFIPEKRPSPVFTKGENSIPVSMGITRGDIGAGGTGLSGHSSQEYVHVGSIDRNENNSVTIELRLIHDKAVENNDVEPLRRRKVFSAPPPV